MKSKKSVIASNKPRDAKGRFVKKYQSGGLKSGLDYKSAANSAYIALPEAGQNIDVEQIPTSPAVTPMANGVYHINTYRSIASTPGGMYRNLDEALRACTSTAKAMLNDVSITAPLMQRWLSLASYNDGVYPQDEHDERQIEVCENLYKDLTCMPRWAEFKKNLMWASWYGKHINIVDWRFDYIDGERKIKANKWVPIIGDKLVFRNNGRMGYLVHMPTGYRDVVYTDRGQAELFSADDMEAIVHHKYFVTDTTWDESQLAIGIEGFGYRHLIYWVYWLKQQLLEWAMNAFQIFGAGGIRIGYFEQSNDESQQQVANAMAQANGQNIILFPRPIGEEKQGAGLEIVSPQGIGIDFFQNFIDDYFGKQINQLLLGFDFNEERKDYYTLQKYDADGLSETITNDLLSVLIKYNYPEAMDWDLKYKISVPVPNASEYMEGIQRMWELGLPLSQTEVYDSLGFTMPTKNKKVLQKPKEAMLSGDSEDRTIKTPNKEIGSLVDQLS